MMTVNAECKSTFRAVAAHSAAQQLTNHNLFPHWHEKSKVFQRTFNVIHLTSRLCYLLTQDSYELIIKKKTAQMGAQRRELSELQAKVAFLENELEETMVTYEQEMEKEKEKSLVMNQASQVELEKLQKVLDMREKELGRIKQLASGIIKQRSELEQFFHDALDQVRQEIAASRLQYKKEAHKAYCWRMQEATAGRLKFPPIRTFHNSPHSTNSVYSDMEAASQW